jgi:hypothetical protein
MRYLVLFLYLLLLACNKNVKKADFEGIWLNKDLLEVNKLDKDILEKNDIYLTAMRFDSLSIKDSVQFYFDKDSIITKWAFKTYDSYNLKLNEDKETMIAFDYTQNEIFFLDRKRSRFWRFVKVNNPAALETYRRWNAYLKSEKDSVGN